MKIEICANSLQSAFNAQIGGANRIELCDNLLEGGTTPSAGVLQSVKKHLNIECFVLIRPRGGDFCYNKWEFEAMLADIRMAKKLGADGIVSGILDNENKLDLQRTIDLIEESRPLPFTFHRAFDVVQEPLMVLEELINIGAARILTSGQANTAIEGKDFINQLIESADQRIEILAGGGICSNNVMELLKDTNLQEIHLSAKRVRFEENGLNVYESDVKEIQAVVNVINRL